MPADEIFSSIVKNRHQLTNFEQDELKFMATLKRKAHLGINGVQDKSFIMNGGSSFDQLVSHARAIDEMSTKMSVVEQTRNLYGRKLAKKAQLELPTNNDP